MRCCFPPSFVNRFVYLNKWRGTEGAKKCCFWKRANLCVYLCVRVRVLRLELPSSQGKAEAPRPQLFIYRLHYCLFEDYQIGWTFAQDTFLDADSRAPGSYSPTSPLYCI